MPEFFEVLKSRRSVRSYTAEPVDRHELQELVDLAVLAPSGMNSQAWTFTVVTNREVLRKLDALVLEKLRDPRTTAGLSVEGLHEWINQPGYTNFYGAPALIVISSDAKLPVASIDCQLAAENLFLAAQARGLGTCYMGFLLMVRGNPAVRDLLRIPEGYEISAAAVVGHPDIRPEGPPKRNPPRVEWVQ